MGFKEILIELIEELEGLRMIKIRNMKVVMADKIGGIVARAKIKYELEC